MDANQRESTSRRTAMNDLRSSAFICGFLPVPERESNRMTTAAQSLPIMLKTSRLNCNRATNELRQSKALAGRTLPLNMFNVTAGPFR